MAIVQTQSRLILFPEKNTIRQNNEKTNIFPIYKYL